MDKYELSIKEDKIKKYAERKEFEPAAKIADTIDWGKVKNIKMLTLVSQVYEKARRYDDAKNVLLYAYERVPVGRRMLYKLTELCIKAGDLDEAQEFFDEFQEIAPNDISKLILSYQLESARGEPVDKLITILELYRKNEFDERWAYELAELYHKAGRVNDCVQLCNEIILWFSVGTYVDKALNLKMQYEPLTPAQQEKLVNKKKFEERVKAVEREFSVKYGESPSPEEEMSVHLPEEEPLPEEDENELTEEAMIMEDTGQLFTQSEFRDIESSLAAAVREAEAEAGQEPDESEPTRDFMDMTKEVPDTDGESLDETKEFLSEVEAALAASVAEGMGTTAEEDDESEKAEDAASDSEEADDLMREVEAALASAVAEDSEPEEPEPEEFPEPAHEEPYAVAEPVLEDEVEEEILDDGTPSNKITCVVVEGEPGDGRLTMAVESLKKTHEILDIPVSQAAKISGAKLNLKGIHGTLEKLAGRDLIIDNAADLDRSAALDLAAEIDDPAASLVIMLVDSSARMNKFLDDVPELDRQCVYLDNGTASSMNADEFVECVENCVREEECVLDEMAGLAVYAVAERMENNGTPLSETAAKDLVSEAIERAEHKGIKGLFGSRYDKAGYLILREQDFQDV